MQLPRNRRIRGVRGPPSSTPTVLIIQVLAISVGVECVGVSSVESWSRETNFVGEPEGVAAGFDIVGRSWGLERVLVRLMGISAAP
jgi:hypothetical protein